MKEKVAPRKKASKFSKTFGRKTSLHSCVFFVPSSCSQIKVRAQVIKNRLGPPLRSADFDIFFDRGIDNFGGWLKVMKDNKLVKQGGAWYEYVDTDTGEVIKFQSKDFIQMMGVKDELRDQIYRKICEATILQYI